SDVTALSLRMKLSVLFCLAVSFAMFGSGRSLQCYSCPDGSSSGCEVKQECSQGEDSCLKLTSGDMIYTGCLRSSDCDFRSLSVRYLVPEFTFSCCQSKLCNGRAKGFFQWLFGSQKK
ncbi:CD59 glycoprotein-like, partial [Salarias fasciatus]|uniref:CD59 glycoprotein-like n=1 Tax=Salarias fasciatus TaxID=181472 RepID=UPI001176FB9C